MQQGLIDKFKRELEIRNFSFRTVKSYMFAVEKFLKFSEERGLNENTLKDYIQTILKKQNPSTVSQNLSAIEFFFEKVLKQKIKKLPKNLLSNRSASLHFAASCGVFTQNVINKQFTLVENLE